MFEKERERENCFGVVYVPFLVLYAGEFGRGRLGL